MHEEHDRATENHFAPGTHTIVVAGEEVTYYVSNDVHRDLDIERRPTDEAQREALRSRKVARLGTRRGH